MLNSDEKTKLRLISSTINLIRYPNSITLFFIEFVRSTLHRPAKDSSVKEAMLMNILNRMNTEGPQAWGLIYLTKQLQIHKKELVMPKKLLELL